MNESLKCCGRECRQLLAMGLAALMLLQASGLNAAAQSPPAQQSQTALASSERAYDELPSAPEPQTPAQQQQPPQQSSQPQQKQPAPGQQPNAPQQPVGTAAAPYEKPTGVPGSRPAGAAIAPAKQKRVRSIVIRVGILVAGAAAVGAVVGLSRASHSQP